MGEREATSKEVEPAAQASNATHMHAVKQQHTHLGPTRLRTSGPMCPACAPSAHRLCLPPAFSLPPPPCSALCAPSPPESPHTASAWVLSSATRFCSACPVTLFLVASTRPAPPPAANLLISATCCCSPTFPPRVPDPPPPNVPAHRLGLGLELCHALLLRSQLPAELVGVALTAEEETGGDDEMGGGGEGLSIHRQRKTRREGRGMSYLRIDDGRLRGGKVNRFTQ